MSDPITAIIAAVIKIGTAIVAAYKTYVVVKAIILIAAAIAAYSITKALSSKPAGTINQGQELQLKLDPTMPRQVIIGRSATGGSQAWAFTFSDDVAIPNKYLIRIIVLSDRPIEGVVKVLEGTNELTFNEDIHTTMADCVQHRVTVDNSPGLYMQVMKGDDSAVALEWLIDRAPAGAWTTNHKGVGIAYVVVAYRYDTTAYPNGEPQLSFIVDGAHVYDDRLSVDNSGSQLLSDNSTWTYSRNASLLLHQTLRGFRTNGILICGSQADVRDIDPENAIAAANTCDEAVSLVAGGTEPRYRAGMLLTSSNTVQTDMDELRAAMDGDVYDRGGNITVLPGGTRTPIMDLDDNDIVWSEERSYQPIASLTALYNVVQGQYVPEAQNFAQETYPIKKDNGFIAQDGGERIVLNADFKAVNSDTQVQRITARILASSRFQTTVGFVGPLWLYELEQGDWFTLTCARWEMTTKVFKVLSIVLTTDLKVAIVAVQTATSIDGWNPADEVPRTTTTNVNPGYSLPVPGATWTPLALTNSTGAEYPVIQYALTLPPGSAATGFNIQIRKFGVTDPFTLPVIPLDQPDGFIQQSLLPSTVYELRARTTDGHLSSAWTSWVDVTTTDHLISTDTKSVGGMLADDLLASLAGAVSDAAAALAEASAIVDESNAAGEAALQDAIAIFNAQAHSDTLSYVNGTPVGTLITTEITRATGAEGQMLHVVSLMGAVSGDGLSFQIDNSTFKVTPTQSLVDKLTLIDSQFAGTSSSSLLTTLNTLSTAQTAQASLVSLLGAQNLGGTAFILNSSTVKVDTSGQSIATYINSLAVSSSTASAIADSRISTQLTSGGSIASALSTVTTTANGASANATLALNAVNGNDASIVALTQVGGKVTGLKIGGAGSDFLILASKFAVVDNSGFNATTVFSIVSGLVNLANPITITGGGKQLVMGPAFGASSDLVMWFGPGATAMSSMTKTNGYFAFGTDGVVYHGSTTLVGGGGNVITVTIPNDPFWTGFLGTSGTLESTSSTGTPTIVGGSGTGLKSYWSLVSGDYMSISTTSGSGLFAVTCSRVINFGDTLSATLRLTVTDDAGNTGFADCLPVFSETH